MKFIGSKLKHLREIKNMSMTELTELTGIKQGYISEIETGKKNPGPAIVEKISTALKIDQLYFYLEESRLPIDVMPDMPPELQKFIANGKNTPWLALTEKAQREGVSLEALNKLIEVLSENKK